MRSRRSRRQILRDMFGASVLVSGCGSLGLGNLDHRATDDGVVVDGPKRPGFPVILICMPSSGPFRAVRRTLAQELAKTFDVETFLVTRETTSSQMGAAIARVQPKCIVLMDNPTVRLYRSYDHVRPAGIPRLPAVIVMTSFLEELQAEVANSTGIVYEVPGVTALVSLRSVIERPVNRVGVIHRSSLRRFVARQKALAAPEQIEIVAIDVGRTPTVDQIVAGLRKMGTKPRVDALWVLNDNELLGDGAFRNSVWAPEVQALDIPVVVGAQSLVAAESAFGTFAVIPDHEGLGVQTANLLLELADNNWQLVGQRVELPLATTVVANVRRIRSLFGLREGAMGLIDNPLD